MMDLLFPFTNLAIAIAVLGLAPSEWFVDWLLIDVFYKIIIGGIVGYGCGKFLGFLLFKLPIKESTKITDDIFAIALVLFPYAVAEFVSSYSFIAVFVSACIFRQKRPEHDYQKRVHQFSITMEGLLKGILMFIIGGYLVFGVLEPLTLPMIAVSLAIIFLVRPISGLIAFTGSDLPKPNIKNGRSHFLGSEVLVRCTTSLMQSIWLILLNLMSYGRSQFLLWLSLFLFMVFLQNPLWKDSQKLKN